jgi:hypothetical protein
VSVTDREFVSFRFLRHVENSKNVMPRKLDAHFIDRMTGSPDIQRCGFRLPRLFSGPRMRRYPTAAVGDMRKRMTRRCVSAATGACR